MMAEHNKRTLLSYIRNMAKEEDFEVYIHFSINLTKHFRSDMPYVKSYLLWLLPKA